jgi:hypothetical protein
VDGSGWLVSGGVEKARKEWRTSVLESRRSSPGAAVLGGKGPGNAAAARPLGMCKEDIVLGDAD